MRKNFLLLGFLFIILVGTSACSSQSKSDLQSVSKDVELFTVDNSISLKKGTTIDGDMVLESADFIGFNYEYNESQKEYIFTFKLTDEGREKMAEATKKSKETLDDLSLWIGTELIVSAKVFQPITDDEFVVNMVEVNEDNISDFVDKLEGKQN